MQLVEQASRYVFAGAGLSAGRSLWHGFKNNWQFFLILVIIFGSLYLPFAGTRNMAIGHFDRGFFKTIFFTFIGSLLMVLIGAAFFLLELGMIASPENDSGWNDLILYFSIALGFLCLSGFIAGLTQRSKRRRAYYINVGNEAFMRKKGFRETGGSDITHYDAQDTPLRVIDIQTSRIVFMVVGARGKRAYINMDNDGRFIDYIPAY